MRDNLVRTRAVWCALVFSMAAAATANARLLPSDLRVEYLASPQGIDVVRPRLSWKLRSSIPSSRGEMQAAYQIQVASSRAAFASGWPDQWETGEVDAPFYRNFLAETRVDQREDGNLSVGGSIWPFYRGDIIWPSWGYMISKGGTSIWERWDTDTQEPGMNGERQCILSGNLAAWFYQTLAGINFDADNPGFKRIILRPRPVGDLRFVKARHESPYGRINSDWKIENGAFHWQFTVPPNTTATVYVPGDAAKISESGKAAARATGVRFIRSGPGAAVYEVGSGSYSFASPWPQENMPAK